MDLQGSLDGSKTPCGTDQKSVHDLLRKEKKDRSEIKRAKERTMAEPIPFKYGNKNSNANVSQFSIKNTDVDGKENKEDYLIFENGTQNKVLIQIQTIERIFKGAQTAQRHLVELTINQFTIRSEVKEKKEHRTRNPKAKEKSTGPEIQKRKKEKSSGPEIQKQKKEKESQEKEKASRTQRSKQVRDTRTISQRRPRSWPKKRRKQRRKCLSRMAKNQSTL